MIPRACLLPLPLLRFTVLTAVTAADASGPRKRGGDRYVDNIRVAQNVSDLRIQPAVLGWVEKRTTAPRQRETARLSSGTKLGFFWDDCKRARRCSRPPYDWLLSNPVLKTDYRNITTSTREHLINQK